MRERSSPATRNAEIVPPIVVDLGVGEHLFSRLALVGAPMLYGKRPRRRQKGRARVWRNPFILRAAIVVAPIAVRPASVIPSSAQEKCSSQRWGRGWKNGPTLLPAG